jgi:glycosyltransferase involved in cell wall biosynthesis
MPEWRVHYLDVDSESIQEPDKYLETKKYWFFRYDVNDFFDVDVVDCRHYREFQMKYLNFYVTQSVLCYLKHNKYDLFFSHGFKSAAVFSMLSKMMNNKKCHYIFDVGCVNGARNDSKYFAIYRKALESNCFLICHSKCQLDFYKKHLSLVNDPAFIRFGVDTEYFRPKGAEKQEYVLSFGNSLRDYDTLLNAWSRMDNRTELHLVGANPSAGKYSGNIKVFPRMSIVDLMKKIEESLFVIIPLPVLNYSNGQMSLLQSMAMGTPVVVTEVPSTVDYVEDGNGAVFVKPYDVQDMYNKIRFMLNDENRMEIASKARRFVVDNCTEEAMAKQIFDYVISTCS